MKLIKIITVLILACTLLACTNNKEQSNNDDGDSTNIDNLQQPDFANAEQTKSNQNNFEGEYLIGDGGTIIVPVNDVFEMRDERSQTTEVLYFQGIEKDTVSVYTTKSKSIVFKMYQGNKFGMYYAGKEQWPVSFIKPLQKEETEEEETARIFKQRHIEDSLAFIQLDTYDGTYNIYTESEGVIATLKLKYNGDQTFNYEWKFEVTAEEVDCKAERKGVLAMDRTQHGFDRNGDCFIHFNFNGYWNGGYLVEIDFEDPTKCPDLTGDCIYSGKYVNKK